MEETGGNWLPQPPSNLCKLYWSPYPFFCAALRKQPRHNVDVTKPLFVAAGPLFPPTKKRLLGQLKSIFTWESHPSNDTIILQFDVQHGLGLLSAKNMDLRLGITCASRPAPVKLRILTFLENIVGAYASASQSDPLFCRRPFESKPRGP